MSASNMGAKRACEAAVSAVQLEMTPNRALRNRTQSTR